MRRLGIQDVLDSRRRLLPSAHADEPDLQQISAGSLTAAEPLEDAQARGYRVGFAEGFTEGEAENERLLAERIKGLEQEAETRITQSEEALDRVRETLKTLITQLQPQFQSCKQWAESLAVEIGYTALTRILSQRQDDHALVEALVRQACADLDDEPVRIRVSQEAAEEIESLSKEVEIIIDDRLTPQTIVLEMPRGEVHTGLELRLEALKRALLEAHSETPEHEE